MVLEMILCTNKRANEIFDGIAPEEHRSDLSSNHIQERSSVVDNDTKSCWIQLRYPV